MPRWKQLRWSSPVCQALALSVVTFCVVMPLCCHRLLYSYYFIRSAYLDAMSDEVLQESLRRGQEALRFWQNLPAPVSAEPTSRRPELLVTVVTSGRDQSRDFHYLLQVMRRLSETLGSCGAERCAQVLLCDVEPDHNPDARVLERHFPVVRRGRGQRDQVNVFEREKRDYVFCLRSGWQRLSPRNVLLLEDDALPRPDFFAVVTQLLSRRAAPHSLYIKLYHPERLQRYWNPEPARLLEWAGLGAVAATALLLALALWNPCRLSFVLCPSHLLFFTLYFMAVAELFGRHYLLELRRASPQLYAVSPATECCTPAMLYPGNASLRVAEYLDASFCSRGNAKDTLLYRLAHSSARSVEPNLITHIGAFSSVRPNPLRPKLI